jgi:hypothetical protein
VTNFSTELQNFESYWYVVNVFSSGDTRATTAEYGCNALAHAASYSEPNVCPIYSWLVQRRYQQFTQYSFESCMVRSIINCKIHVRKRLWPDLRCSPAKCMERLRKPTKKRQDNCLQVESYRPLFKYKNVDSTKNNNILFKETDDSEDLGLNGGQ